MNKSGGAIEDDSQHPFCGPPHACRSMHMHTCKNIHVYVHENGKERDGITFSGPVCLCGDLLPMQPGKSTHPVVADVLLSEFRATEFLSFLERAGPVALLCLDLRAAESNSDVSIPGDCHLFYLYL